MWLMTKRSHFASRKCYKSVVVCRSTEVNFLLYLMDLKKPLVYKDCSNLTVRDFYLNQFINLSNFKCQTKTDEYNDVKFQRIIVKEGKFQSSNSLQI